MSGAVPKVVERWRDGAPMYDVERLSWEAPGVDRRQIVVRSFLSAWQAEQWVTETQARQHLLHEVAVENFHGPFPHSSVDTAA